MDWNMLIVLLGGMLLGAGGMGLFLRRRPPREQQYARDMAMLADRLERASGGWGTPLCDHALPGGYSPGGSGDRKTGR